MKRMDQDAITIERAESGGWLVRSLEDGVPTRILLASDNAGLVMNYACNVVDLLIGRGEEAEQEFEAA